VLRHSKDPDGSVLVLLFGRGDRWPRRAVKVAGQAGAGRLRQEEATLRALAERGGRQLADRVPRVLGLHEQRDRVALVTPGRPGVPMLVRYHRPGHTSAPGAVRADLRAAEAWLARLHADTTGPRRPLDVPPGTVDRLLAHAAADATAARALDRLAGVQGRLRRHTAPTAVVHGDFWAGNVLVDQGAVSGVVDWERAEVRGGPLRDAARFAMTYCYYLDRHTRPGHRVRAHQGLVAGDPGNGVRYGLDGSGWCPDAVRAFLSRAATRAGVPAACARDAVLGELAAAAGEASDLAFRRSQLALFVALSEAQP
jgi:aminoglycoside phosphotransferase (APT) family kinase protein